MVWNVNPVRSAMSRQSARSSQATRRIRRQPELDDAWPVPPNPPRGVPLVDPGLVVVGVVVVVVDTRVGVGVVVRVVGVRVNRGFDQWPPLLVRVQLECDPPLLQERCG